MDITLLLGKKLLFFDGGMGSMIQKALPLHSGGPELVNITNPEVIVDIHRQFLRAGANVITANTLGAYSHKFSNYEEIIAKAIINAKTAIARENTQAFTALDLGPVGTLLAPLGEMAFEDCYHLIKETAVFGEKYGADLAIIETMTDTYEAKAAILAVKENTGLPVICTMTFDERGKTLTGGNIEAMVSLLEGLGVSALGINCGLGPDQIEGLFDRLAEICSIPVLIQPNAGLPKIDKNKNTYYDLSPEAFSDSMKRMCKKGAWILGGCCGTTPAHIGAMVSECIDIVPPPVLDKGLTMVSSYGNCCILDNGPAVVGERINPTGKKAFKAALLNHDMNFIVNEALSQKEGGAHILDVNVGLPEIDEPAYMVEVVKAIQAVCDLPLQIDSSTPSVIEAALRVYNGKAVINSVTGKQESMDAIFPLVKKYGGAVIGLTIDEKGVPHTAEERIAIAKKIIANGAKWGIMPKDIIIDPLTLTVSAQQDESKETLKAMRAVKERFGVKTLAGVSNVSFGLPNRQMINAAYLALALDAGAGLCIINPASEIMMGIYNAYQVLSGNDQGCTRYIETYTQKNTGNAPGPEKEKTEHAGPRLKEYIIKGLKDQAYTETCAMLQSIEPLEIINTHLVAGLDHVGAEFETGRMFLPQLIMSAESAKKAFQAINEFIALTGASSASKGKILIATVEGDSHDIGKNIVKALLENYGYDTIDLGKDVPVETVVSKAKQNQVTLVGLSALMTTTVINMERTIRRLKEELPDCKIMVGGAVLNPEYARMINADFYAKDALAAVTLAKKHFKH